MEVVSSPKTLRGRTVGIAVLVPVQFVIGAIHVFFGFWLLTANNSFSFISSEEVPLIYPAYTLAFGFLVLIFTYGVWLGRKWGWTGTVLVSMFVTAADVLTLLNLPSVPGIPKFAAGIETLYSVVLLLYLFQSHVRAQFT